ncbi:MAG TPA: 1-deoxy-D-xylulose-5-phosphate reductoisomerase, partial [Thermotogota bacterium]|nr:1-deoxy-D-xylulose-5-phosphate reductoisomerase [Thermotogota bacterium]
PVDSEHSGLFQLLLGTDRKEIRKVYITASGGALRDWDESRKENASVEQVLRHPNWQMGAKITVDSATLMNKALEMIEAKFLFDLPKETIAAAFCHNSFVHAVLAYWDGHFKIHAGPPDMRIPIAYSLTYPERVSVLEENGTAVEDPRSLFEPMILKPADTAVHPPLRLAQAVIDAPSSLRIALNAANEAAVLLFLQRKVTFGELTRLVERTVLSQEAYEVTELSQILELHEGIKRRVELDYSC